MLEAQFGQGPGQQRYRAHDHAHRQPSALTAQDAQHVFAQVFDIAVDQPRVADHATAHFVGHQTLGLALEQRHAEQRFDFMQRLGGAGLGNGNLLGGLVQRAALIQCDQQAQLFEAQACGDAGK
ncbi:hypothetical protein D3C87_1685450 [compost metagenome]